MVTYERAISDDSLRQILKLQSKNLKQNVSAERQASQGFVTACHTFDELKNINDASNAVIAMAEGNVVGYALAMKRETGEKMPVFNDLFNEIDKIVFEAKPLNSFKYIFVGQLCVDEAFRGQGLVENMYANFKKAFQAEYDFAITDISAANPRSLKAHQKSGFTKIHCFYDAFTQSNWDIVLMDLRR